MQGEVSERGKGLAAQRPSFLAVLSDLWSPTSNRNGIVNLGLAENVGQQPIPHWTYANKILDTDARGDGGLHKFSR